MQSKTVQIYKPSRRLAHLFDDRTGELILSRFHQHLYKETLEGWKQTYTECGGDKLVEYLLMKDEDTPVGIQVVIHAIKPSTPADFLRLFTTEEVIKLLSNNSEPSKGILGILHRNRDFGASECKKILVSSNNSDCVSVLSRYGVHPELIRKFLDIFGQSEVEDILSYEENGTCIMSYILSSTATEDVCKAIEFLIGRTNPKTCMALLLKTDQEGWPIIMALRGNFKEVLDLFKREDHHSLLKSCVLYELELIHCMLMSPCASEVAMYIYETEGEEMLLGRLVNKDQNGKMVLQLALDRWDYELFIEVLKIFTPENLANMLNDQDGAGYTVLYYIMISVFASEAANFISQTIGYELFIEFLLRVTSDEGCSVISQAVQKWDKDQIIKILKVFDSNGIEKLFKKIDTAGLNVMYYILESKTAEVFLRHLGEMFPTKTDIVDFLTTVRFVPEPVRETLEAWLYAGDSKHQDFWPRLCRKMRWLIHQLKNSCYCLTVQPSILVISIQKGRQPGAIEEAKSIIDAFKSLDLHVTEEVDLTTDQIMQAIKEQQDTENGEIGQIVVLMSHGSYGIIEDVEGNSVPIEDLVGAMLLTTHPHSPKVLILQCCQHELTAPASSPSGESSTIPPELTSPELQNTVLVADEEMSSMGMPSNGEEPNVNSGESNAIEPELSSPDMQENTNLVADEDQAADGEEEDETFPHDGPKVPSTQGRKVKSSPTQIEQKNVVVMMSSITGQKSFRNFFIPKIASAIRKLGKNDCLHRAFLDAHNEMDSEGPRRWLQIPINKGTPKSRISLRNIYRD